MKKIFTLLTFLILAGVVSVSAKNKKTVFIIIDGVPADVIERVNTPTIDQIAAIGGYARAQTGGTAGGYSQTPTISAVGYNNLLTATWANKHNVWGNDVSNPNYHYWNIFRIAKNQSKSLKTAIFSGWIDNRTKLIGENRPAAGNIKMDYVLDGLDLDTDTYPHEDKDLQIFKIDEKISEAAATYIAKNGPDLTWVYLWYMDDAGHCTGTGDYFDEYLVKADKQVERVWKAVQQRQKETGEEWMIVVTSDHGRTSPDGYGHGGQSERERSIWISTNLKPNKYFAAEQPDITDITPSICRFMGWTVPDAVQYEWDGVPFIGKLDVTNPTAKKEGNKITLNWKNYSTSPVTIYVSNTNNFSKGGVDNWIEIGKTKAGNQQFVYDCSNNPSTFYKFSIRGKSNAVNVWVKE